MIVMRVRLHPAVLVFIVAGLVGPATIQAQSVLPSLENRLVRVRLCADSIPVIGSVENQTERMLTLRSYGESRLIPLSEVGRVEIRSHDRGRSATLGIFLGAAAGALAYRVTNGSDEFSSLRALFVAAPVGGLVGGVAGATLARERWTTFRSQPCL